MVPKPINGYLYLPIVAGLGRFLMPLLGKMRVIIGVAPGVLLLLLLLLLVLLVLLLLVLLLLHRGKMRVIIGVAPSVLLLF